MNPSSSLTLSPIKDCLNFGLDEEIVQEVGQSGTDQDQTWNVHGKLDTLYLVVEFLHFERRIQKIRDLREGQNERR